MSAAPTPSGFCSFSRIRADESSVVRMNRSSASKPLEAHSCGSPFLARNAAFALTGKISGVTPSSRRALSAT